MLNSYLDEIEYYVKRKWVHPKSARLLVIEPDNQGTSPLIGWMAFHHPWIKRQLGQGGGGGVSRQSHHVVPRGADHESKSLSDYWNLACRMLLFATMNIRPHAPHSSRVLVHRCAAVSIYCPVSLLEWVVSPRPNDDGWAPGDASATTPDNHGKLPIHRSLEAVYLSSIFDEDVVHHGADFDSAEPPETEDAKSAEGATSIVTADATRPWEEALLYKNPKLEKNRLHIARKLLQWHPQAVRVPFSNGRSPLVQAISHGAAWNESDPENNNIGLLQLLWHARPQQAVEIDPVTGLYPFMLAATIPLGRKDAMESRCDQLGNIFELLRKDPQLVAGALPADY